MVTDSGLELNIIFLDKTWARGVRMRLLMLAMLATVNMANAADRLSEEEKGIAAYREANAINMILRLYALENGKYPSEEQGLAMLTSSSASPKGEYFKREPIDPWGRNYVYTASPFCSYVFSLGADGKTGGNGFDADIYPYGMPCGTPNN